MLPKLHGTVSFGRPPSEAAVRLAGQAYSRVADPDEPAWKKAYVHTFTFPSGEIIVYEYPDPIKKTYAYRILVTDENLIPLSEEVLAFGKKVTADS